MAFRYILTGSLALALSCQVLAVPVANSAVCKNPTIRKEWRSLAVEERKDYIRAVKCLLESKPKTQVYADNIRNRYEDFVAMHLNTTLGGWDLKSFRGGETLFNQFLTDPKRMAGIMVNHSPEQILPWHRWTIQLYEDVLRDECGYKGGQPYWDYHLDSQEAGGDFLRSPIFDAESGFGGNGAKTKIDLPFNPSFLNSIIPGLQIPSSFDVGGGCVKDGPFKDIVLHIGPTGQMAGASPRCLTRNLDAMQINMGATKKNYARVLKSKTFAEFGLWIESPDFHIDSTHATPFGANSDFHSIGHGAIGGELLDAFNSVNDPLFWMHHTSMDRLWALWQDQDHAGRLQNAPNASLWIGHMAPKNRTIAEVYDTLNRDGKGILCYKYEGLDFSYYSS